ncbi:MAG TPA: hypothetical protein VJQ48_01695, partial [Candidatus Binatia bacterium]|nr:hypothetical protein [Candidatus Binatia bacterium]
LVADVFGQEQIDRAESQLTLRKSAETREYKGAMVQGENRRIGPGDSLWRILIQERGLTQRKFSQYVIVVQALNPQMKSASVLKVGDTVFIPMRPDEVLVVPSTVAAGGKASNESLGNGLTTDYRVKRGNHLYQILREQLKITDEKELATYYALVKDLNPQRKEWDVLQEGEVIQLPADKTGAVVAQNASSLATRTEKLAQSYEPSTPPQNSTAVRAPLPLDHARRLLAQENLPLLAQVLNTVGIEVESDGDEVFPLPNGTVRLDKASYPIVLNRKLQQRVILDTRERLPTSLRKSFESPDAGTSVFSLATGANLQETVSQLLSRLGYQALPSDRPISIQQGDVAFEAMGTWIAAAPEESGKAQEIFIITVTDQADEIPEYLQEQLSAKGVHLKEVVLASSSQPQTTTNETTRLTGEVKIWPREKSEKIDALLLAYGIPFGVAEPQSVEMGEGLRFETQTDRIFESKGQRIGLFFHQVQPEIKKALQQRQGMKVVELDLSSMSAKEIITRVLGELRDQTVYREHKFSADNGNKDRVNISTAGFWLRNRSIFLTDRQIPPSLHRFFFEKGLDLVYFD